MNPITITELLAVIKQLPNPKEYKWASINLAPNVRFHKNKDGDWQANNPIVVDSAARNAK